MSAFTIADGLRAWLCQRTLDAIRVNVDELETVIEAQIMAATQLIWRCMKIVVESSGALLVMNKPSAST